MDTLAEYNLHNWTVTFDRARGRLGLCNHKKKTLSFSAVITPHLSKSQFQNTVLHEVAHARTPGHGHDNIWKRLFISMGGDGNRLSNIPENALRHVSKYELLCAKTGRSLGFLDRKSKNFAEGKWKCNCCKVSVEIVQLR